MQDALKALLAVRELDDEIRDLERSIEAKQRDTAGEEAAVRRATAELEETREQIKELQKRVDQRNLELATAEEAIKKMEDQLQALKTNEEYAAMQKQIAGKRDGLSEIEDRILEAMEVLESGRGNLPGREAALKEREQAFKTKRTAVDAEIASLGTRLEEARKGRTQGLEAVPEDARKVYDAANARHPGNAMASVGPDGVCQGCYLKIRNNELNRVMGGKVHPCDNCGRILTYAL